MNDKLETLLVSDASNAQFFIVDVCDDEEDVDIDILPFIDVIEIFELK